MERKISYKREMKHNYLMIEGEASAESQYETKMLISNPIEGLLRFRMKKVDSQCYFCYEITSRQPLSRLLESRSIEEAEIRQLILDIAHTLTVLEEYLLKEEQILLEPEFVYVEPDLFGVELCLVPGKTGDFPGEMSRLLEYLLGKVDYQDKNAVVMVYGLYRESLKENYGMENLFRLMRTESKEEDESEDRMEEPRMERMMVPESLVETKSKKSERKKPAWKGIAMGIAAAAGSLALLWLLMGAKVFWKFGPVMAGAELVLAAAWGFLRKGTKAEKTPKIHKNQKQEEEEKAPSWQMSFDEENEEVRLQEAAEVREKSQIRTPEPLEGNTVLLLDLDEKKAMRKLVGMEKDTPDIVISYYPFIIGKQENLVDFILDRDTVSRLHLRLDERDGGYRITDLNSTNGTAVNGTPLENNETFEIKPGDEVEIANYRFKFL